MKTKNDQASKLTLRQSLNFLNATAELSTRGSYHFRCTVAGLAMEAKHHIELHNESIKTSKGMQAYQEEIKIIRENCTSEKDGKKKVDQEAFMPLYESATIKHSKAIEQSEKLNQEINKRLDEPVEYCAKLIPYEMMLEADKEEKFSTTLLTNILPFVAEKV